MPARNVYHDAVIRALVADGWTITDDPLKLEYGDRKLYVDLAAECFDDQSERVHQWIESTDTGRS